MFCTRRIFGDIFPDRPKKTVVRLKSFGRSVKSFRRTLSEHSAANHGSRAGLQSLLGDGAIVQRRLPPPHVQYTPLLILHHRLVVDGCDGFVFMVRLYFRMLGVDS